MPKDTLLPSQPKVVYRIKNSPEYNPGLIERGNVTVWMDERMFLLVLQTPGRRGRRVQRHGNPDALTLKSVYRLPLRALQGFTTSLQRLAMPDWVVPNYSTLRRRAKSLRVTLPVLRKAGEAVHLLVDSTGLNLFNEGEWKVRKHGYSKRRSWRKVHLALDAKTGQVCAVLMTHRDVDDASVLPELLGQLPPQTNEEIVGGDGAYDSQAARAAIAGCGAMALVPAVKGTVQWPASQAGASERNADIDHIAQSGRQDWKDKSGYHCRSLVENLMYRLKTLTGYRLWARDMDVQDAEVAVRVGILNRMMVLARPNSVRVV